MMLVLLLSVVVPVVFRMGPSIKIRPPEVEFTVTSASVSPMKLMVIGRSARNEWVPIWSDLVSLTQV